MGLETGEFIDDLIETNPITATDPVSEGSDHIRLLKKVLLQSFPGVDEAVTLTTDELNDAALKSAVQIITGDWDFAAATLFSVGATFSAAAQFDAPTQFSVASEYGNGIPVTWRNFADTVNLAILNLNASDEIDLGDASTPINIKAQLNAAESVVLANDIALQGLDTVAAQQALIAVNASDLVVIGNTSLNVFLRALAIADVEIGGITVASFVDRANGSLGIDDIDGTTKKAGFRNPTSIDAGTSRDLDQSDEGRILLAINFAAVYTAETLEAFTTIRMIVSATGPVTLVPGAGVSINVLDGGGAAQPAASGISIEFNSVIEIVYEDALTVQVFGNGIAVI